ncbi:MAG TPA: signal peptidase II [Streptosporangiaceae bacterium]
MTSISPTPREGGTAGPASPARRLLVVLLLAAVVIVADQGTKQWALSGLADGRTVTLPTGFIHLHLLVNAGAAFSFATGETWFITVCACAAVLTIPWFAFRARSWLLVVALGLLLGGAAGNLIDRLARAPGPGRGRVVDFIDYHGWFTGNVADIAIVVSAALLIVRAGVISRRERRAAQAPREARDDPAGGDPAKAA